MLSDERLAEIEALARKATSPTWHQGYAWKDAIMIPYPEGLGGPHGERVLLRMNEHFPHEDDCAFIGAMQPETVLALVDDARRLRHERDELGKAIAEAALKAHVYNGEVSLTGPDLILLCQDMAEYARRQDRDIEFLARIASAAERVVRLRGWTSDAEAHPGRGEAERELARLVEEWRK